jgi:hypothetical protein
VSALRALIGQDALVSDEAERGQVPRENRALVSQIAADDPPGGLYASYGAVSARAVASAVAHRDPRRRAYLRRLILMTALFVVSGVVLTIAAAALFG